MKARWFKKVYKLKLMCILNLTLANFFFIIRFCLSKNCKIYLLIIFTDYIKKLSSAGAIKRTNSRKESLLTTINTIYIYMIHFRSNHLNFSILIRETNALYEACEAIVIIIVIKGVGAGEEVIILFISLSLFSLRLIRCTFDR
jgi:hypothetical protein